MGIEHKRKLPEKVARAIRGNDTVGLKNMARAAARKRAENADLKKAVSEFLEQRKTQRDQEEMYERAQQANEHIVPVDED